MRCSSLKEELSIEFTVVHTLITLTYMKDTGLPTKVQQDFHDCFVPIHWMRGQILSPKSYANSFRPMFINTKDLLADVTVMKYLPKLKDG